MRAQIVVLPRPLISRAFGTVTASGFKTPSAKGLLRETSVLAFIAAPRCSPGEWARMLTMNDEWGGSPRVFNWSSLLTPVGFDDFEQPLRFHFRRVAARWSGALPSDAHCPSNRSNQHVEHCPSALVIFDTACPSNVVATSRASDGAFEGAYYAGVIQLRPPSVGGAPFVRGQKFHLSNTTVGTRVFFPGIPSDPMRFASGRAAFTCVQEALNRFVKLVTDHWKFGVCHFAEYVLTFPLAQCLNHGKVMWWHLYVHCLLDRLKQIGRRWMKLVSASHFFDRRDKRTPCVLHDGRAH